MEQRAFHDPGDFAFVGPLESAFDRLRAELDALDDAVFVESPDSLTTRSGRYDETGWLYLALLGDGVPPQNRARCPLAARTCEAVPGVVNAGLSLLRPGTHLFPHRGELPGVLRCHLPLRVPDGDLGLCVGGETRAWRLGRCLVFDDTLEHEAWNHADGDRVVLLVTFPAGSGSAASSLTRAPSLAPEPHGR